MSTTTTTTKVIRKNIFNILRNTSSGTLEMSETPETTEVAIPPEMGIVGGVVALVIFVGIVAYCFMRKSAPPPKKTNLKKSKMSTGSPNTSSPTGPPNKSNKKSTRLSNKRKSLIAVKSTMPTTDTKSPLGGTDAKSAGPKSQLTFKSHLGAKSQMGQKLPAEQPIQQESQITSENLQKFPLPKEASNFQLSAI